MSPLKPVRRHATRIKAEPEAELPQDMSSPDRYLDRELSWLEFNLRVLHEAEDPRTPLLERVRFLSIFTSNLDEFVMKRVGLTKRQIHAGVTRRKASGRTPEEQFAAVRKQMLALVVRQGEIYLKQILPALAAQGIRICEYKSLSDPQRAEADGYFRSKVFPILTPLAVDPGHPFPFISNLSTSLGIALRHPEKEEKLFARVKVPEVLPPFVRAASSREGPECVFIGIGDLIRHNLDALFPGMEILSVMPFRITRNADVEQQFEEAEDLLEVVEQELRQRKFERVVRLEHGPAPDPWMLQFLMQELELAGEDVYELPALLDYTALRAIADLPFPKLRYEPWSPLLPQALQKDDLDLFSVIRNGDVLLHHPYESFSQSIERFVRAAADDPHVLAIKITLYRTGDDSPFIPTLIRAAEEGKQVVALVELKARFDEERNIFLAQALEKAGVHVVYGVIGLKTHTKTTLVVRQETEGLRCYAHIGTGNYNVVTAKLYTDLSLLTCRADLTEDLVELFHFLTGRSLQKQYRKLLVAPVNMHERFIGMIEREIANQKAGQPARIVAKMNSLEEYRIIEALYRASQAGVPVDLLVRGFCCLRPGVPGMSENIRVTSVIGRFLEHSRIFHFAAGEANPAQGEFYIGSADWMYRNLQARVELVTPVEDPAARVRLWEILQVCMKDQRQAWDMRPDGSYVQRKPDAAKDGPEALGTHALLMQAARKAAQPAG